MALINYLNRRVRLPAPHPVTPPRLPTLGGGGPGWPIPKQLTPAIPGSTVPAATAERPTLPTPPTSTDPYGQALATDPGYQQFIVNQKGERQADLSGFGTDAARAFIQFGEMPTFSAADMALFKDLPQLDAGTGQLAQANTDAGLSTLARLKQAFQDAVRNDTNQLGGRGIYRSGETGFQLGREQTAYARSQYDARQALLDFLSGRESSFTAAERARIAARQGAATDAAARQQAILAARGPLTSGVPFRATPFPAAPYAAGLAPAGYPNPTYR